jgi:DNA processing protein
MDRETIGYYAAFSQCPRIGPMRFNSLLEYFGSVKKAYSAPRSQLEKVLDSLTASTFIEFRSKFDIIRRLNDCDQKGIHILARHDPRFPQLLLNFADPPICLYAKGSLDTIDFNSDRFFAIVGTRAPTTYGEWVAEKFAQELSEHFIIVSGLAYGIDFQAHKAALDAGRRTVAFLGCGVDIPYPAKNISVYNRIIEGGGLVMSEFPPGMRTLKGLFVSRNRHISGLSEGVFVVEGSYKSGTRITAKYALDQGKEVFVPPVPINSITSQTPQYLLDQGATLVFDPADILRAYGFAGSRSEKQVLDLLSFEPDAQRVLGAILNESRRIDDIILMSGLVPNQVMNTLTMLEVSGTVVKNMDGTYQLAC